MRDPKRIDAILTAVGDIWKEYPDLRLCQLLINLTGKDDPYHVEDDVLAKNIIDFRESMRLAKEQREASDVDHA